jgi:hypothetical protein
MDMSAIDDESFRVGNQNLNQLGAAPRAQAVCLQRRKRAVGGRVRARKYRDLRESLALA